MIILGPGDTNPLVGMVKRRLGAYPSDDYFTDDLAARVRGAQTMLGLEVTGLIEQDLLERLHLND